MSDEIDREIREVTTKNVTPLPNSSVNGSRLSEQRTTQVSSDNTSNGVILGIVVALAIGAGAIAYFLNTRPEPTPIVLPRATDTLKENKTIIERSTTKEVSPAPATSQITPKIDVTLPPVTITQPPAPAPTTTIMIQPEPVAPVTPPQTTTQPHQSTSPSPTPSAVK
ncbi:MAG: hypothetical protein WCP16_16900 [Pseudanabaena sp. ELA645]